MTDTAGQPAAQIITCPTCGRANRVPAAARGKPTCAQCHNPLPWLVAALVLLTPALASSARAQAAQAAQTPQQPTPQTAAPQSTPAPQQTLKPGQVGLRLDPGTAFRPA